MTQKEIVERNKYIRHLVKEGMTSNEIAVITGLKKERVLGLLKAFGIKAAKESHKLHSEKAQAIVKELKAGNKQIEISRKLNVSRQYVNQVKITLEALESNEK